MKSTKRQRTKGDRVLVVGSINVDLYQRMADGTVRFRGAPVDVTSIKGQTLPAKSFVQNPGIKPQIAKLPCKAGEEEAFVLSLEGPFDQKTGGKGANAAAAAGQTWPCEFVGNLGAASADANVALRADLAKYGAVETGRCQTIPNCATGTAYILSFSDGDNAILLIGGANQQWPEEALAGGRGGQGSGQGVEQGVGQEVGQEVGRAEGQGLEQGVGPAARHALDEAMDRAVAVMLQREIPPDINARVAAMADTAEVPVVLDVGGTDEPVDPAILPHVSLIAPNESELAFISGVPAQAISDGGHIPVAASIPGGVSLSGLRAGVAALKAKFSAAGNHRVEVLVTLGRLGSVHFGAEWTPASSHLDHAEGGDGGAAASGGAEHGGATASGGAGNEPATGIDGMLPHETRMGVFDIKGGTPLDTTGAGDCYRGSYVAARYGDGKSVAEAMRWAAAASSLAVETTGAMPSMPCRADIAERAAGTILFAPFG